jgi:hypothetical protein
MNILFVLGTALLLNGCAATGLHHHGHAAAGPAFQRDMDVSMAQMMTDMHSPGYSGNPDLDFLAMMIPHHQGAVDMAKLVLVHGRDPAVRMLAEEIIAGQTIEIESMQRRLAALRRVGAATPENNFPALGGNRGPAPTTGAARRYFRSTQTATAASSRRSGGNMTSSLPCTACALWFRGSGPGR